MRLVFTARIFFGRAVSAQGNVGNSIVTGAAAAGYKLAWSQPALQTKQDWQGKIDPTAPADFAWRHGESE